MNEWIARVMPLPVRDEPRTGEPPIREVARFRLRIISPHSRPGIRPAGQRWDAADLGPVRLLALDTVNPFGGVGGSLDSQQVAWLVRELDRARDRYVVVASYDSSLTMTSDRTRDGQAPRILGTEVTSILLAHDQVVAWISSTMHHRAGRRHGDASHGFWELPAASDGRDAPLAGGLSIARREDRGVLIMRGALASGHGPIWELRDPAVVPERTPVGSASARATSAGRPVQQAGPG